MVSYNAAIIQQGQKKSYKTVTVSNNRKKCPHGHNAMSWILGTYHVMCTDELCKFQFSISFAEKGFYIRSKGNALHNGHTLVKMSHLFSLQDSLIKTQWKNQCNESFPLRRRKTKKEIYEQTGVSLSIQLCWRIFSIQDHFQQVENSEYTGSIDKRIKMFKE